MSKSNATSSAAPRVLLVGVDFSDASVRAIDMALDMTSGAAAPTVLHALIVDERPLDAIRAETTPEPASLIEEVGRLRLLVVERLRAAIQRHGTLSIRSAQAHGTIGSPAREIAHVAAELGADLVIVGTNSRRGLERAFLGSVAEKSVRLCGCPVLVARAKSHAELDTTPAIEPICPQCAARRLETKGAELWCAQHAQHHPRAHAYSYEGPSSDPARPWGFDA